MKHKKELNFLTVKWKCVRHNILATCFLERWPLRLDVLETQMWISIIFNNFPSCIISLSKQKSIGKGFYWKPIFKPIYLHFYKSEIFYKRMVLSKTSTLWLCSGINFPWQIQQITWDLCNRKPNLKPLVIVASSKRHKLQVHGRSHSSDHFSQTRF